MLCFDDPSGSFLSYHYRGNYLCTLASSASDIDFLFAEYNRLVPNVSTYFTLLHGMEVLLGLVSPDPVDSMLTGFADEKTSIMNPAQLICSATVNFQSPLLFNSRTNAFNALS